MVFSIFLSVFVVQAQQSVRLSVSPAGMTPGVGDTFHIIIDIQNVSGQPSEPASVPGCKVLFMRQRKVSTISRVVNGVSSTITEVSYALTLRAEKAGSFTFGPISVGGVRSNILHYKISDVSSSQSSSNQQSAAQGSNGPVLTNPGGSDLFLKATVSDSSPYEQQGVVYTVKLYTTYSSIFDWISTTAPSFGNCTYESSDDVSHSLTRETYNGKSYYTAVIARYIIYPTQAGVAKIKGNSYTGSVGRTMEYSDPYFGFMSKMVPTQVDAKPNDIELSVRPLPGSDKYEDINGVGQFKVGAELVSKNFKTHQAAVVRYTVSGTGNMSFVSLPDLSEKFPSELKFLKSEDSDKKQVGASSVSGSITFDCTFIPQKEGDFEIPALKFNFFDPEKGTWYTVTTQSFHIKVGEGASTHSADASLKFIDKLQPVGKLDKTHKLIISKLSYWLWFIIPVVLLVAVLFIYHKRLSLLSDTELLRLKQANSLAKKRLRAAYLCMKRKDTAHFYDEMLHSLWGYLSDKLGIPTSDLTRDNVSMELQSAGVSATVINDTIALIDECEFAKYASASGSDMDKIYSSGCHVINALESEIGKNHSK